VPAHTQLATPKFVGKLEGCFAALAARPSKRNRNEANQVGLANWKKAWAQRAEF
jgi:hypothetical protein